MIPNYTNVSLELARRLSGKVSAAWESGEMQREVSPVTAGLLRYWFDPAYCETRGKNFHAGQRQAILNTIYLHEVVGEKRVTDAYEAIAPELMPAADMAELSKDKYQFPKYAIKMATGTGKTWVMHALITWQLLNARHETERSGRFTQKFLVVAPGLIVYDRLLDAFCGRQTDPDSPRSPETNDFSLNSELLLPPQYRDEVLAFVQTNSVMKEDIGRKVTGDGLIALTNWHLFIDKEAGETDEDEGETEHGGSVQAIVRELLPIRPGKTAGNDLNQLDRQYLKHTAVNYLAALDELMVINDEAHHIHETKREGETEEVEWQRGLDMVRENKRTFFQADFSATPYDMRGTAKKRVKIYFPHIIVDFNLPTAIRMGLVKVLLLDKRQNFTTLPNLDFRSVRNGRRVVGLSDDQRIMLRAGLTKLRMLERDFTKLDPKKRPKMLVACEETGVSPYVEDFLLTEGLNDEDIVTIDSNRKDEVSAEEWKRIRTELFNIDRKATPKVIISVMMLREGFDVNNICVLVALRKAGSEILVEQLIGRGLRLMWREPVFQEQKEADRELISKQLEPSSYLDTLSIVEHPAFMRYYEEYIKESLVFEDTSGTTSSGKATGDIISVNLRDNYADFDFSWPVILHEAEEEFANAEISIASLEPFTAYPLGLLRKFLADKGENFVSQEILTQTTFGKYKVTGDLFRAQSYNEYLQKILHTITTRIDNFRRKGVPTMQINGASIVGAIDSYIRTRLFKQPFNPFEGADWKILLAQDGVVTQHIVREFSKAIREMQISSSLIPAKVRQIPFSSVATIRMRESSSVPVSKCIYERMGYSAHGGELEHSFIEFLDKDGSVERFLKINEAAHAFAAITYFRADGLPASYFPDFIVATHDNIYLVETKADSQTDDPNVRQKQLATTEWVERVNELPAEERMERKWEYLLLKETSFYALAGGGATIDDIVAHCRVTTAMASGKLF